MIKKFKTYIKESIENNDPYNEEIWDDETVFNKNDMEILIANWFVIEREEDVDDSRIRLQIAHKYEKWNGEMAYVELSKYFFKSIYFDIVSTDYILQIYKEKPNNKPDGIPEYKLRIISFEKKTIEECMDSLYNYKPDISFIEL